MRTLAISFAGLIVTAGLQALVFAFSGSIALLSDTLHNAADAFTAVPLAIAFTLGRRMATRRYTYGYGRAEDLAGIVVVLVITASAAVAAYEAISRLFSPQPVSNLGLVAVAAIVGFLGNEFVAQYRIHVGKQIGSAALVADGMHARADGFTSLGVLLAAILVWRGFPLADPILGLIITLAILVILVQAAREIYYRLMDAVDPELLAKVEGIVEATRGVEEVGELHLRWIGHSLHAEVEITLDDALSLVEAHGIAFDVEHELLHNCPRLYTATVHVNPREAEGVDHHAHRHDEAEAEHSHRRHGR